MLENSLSCAVLHIAAAVDSVVTVSYNGIIVYELHNGLGWSEITDENSIHYLCNISQFGEYVIQASLEGVTRTEKVVIEDTKNYFVSVKILFIYNSKNYNYNNYQTETQTYSTITDMGSYLWTRYTTGSGRQTAIHSNILTINNNIQEYKTLIADIEVIIDNISDSANKPRLRVSNSNSWSTVGTSQSSESYVARTFYTIDVRKNVIVDVSNLSGSYIMGITGFQEVKLYNLYLA